jgi:hypothetical protein
MTITSTEKFLQAAIAEDGQPVSAGGPPLRSLTNGKPQSSNGEQAPENILMRMVKIQIPDKKESARALVEMSRRDRVDCYANDVYIVPESALGVLAELGIAYQELGRKGSKHDDRSGDDCT